MYSAHEVALVNKLWAEGKNKSEISRATGISRFTIREWLEGRTPDFDGHRVGAVGHARYACPVCTDHLESLLPREEYVYLLGLYLGDGCLSVSKKGVYRLRIACCDAYPQLMDWCEEAMSAVLPTKVGRIHHVGCTELYSDSKHWGCLFPQHGSGRKHERKIELVPWQQELVDADPRPLIRGLIHSDGTRVLNRAVGTDYPPYPRYHFTNASADIREIFTRACDAIGVEWRYNNARNISVAKRASVAILDSFIEPKS
ncbi:transcriptional regulator [Phytoactinopolyspora halotolerans]|uniref:Transcriptional regulator n=1 Tax=Phytoactinopolyspora halotolerans TaxID=1981512 RepID=A0A6L9SDT5_9ACTN|nr:transcriptional regulator [Phytoactinopolyspora halotolerans]NEE02220.1 transcriptional regulator [Phytoactinopolyspora halotolerans]